MITVREAQNIILAQAQLFPTESIRLEDAYGRVLREDIACDRDQPAFHKSTMDGIAIRFDQWQKGARKFNVTGVIGAGRKALALKDAAGCVEIMTGAVVPDECDCVIPIEQVVLNGKIATIVDYAVLKRGQFIRPRGADHQKGAAILHAGMHFTPTVVAAAASFGRARVKVSAKPKIALIATGDELVDIRRKAIKPFQIRLSNSYALDATLRRTGLCDTQMFHLKDDKNLLLREIKKILSQFDILVLSGGVSMGAFDYVPEVLRMLGVDVLFHKVAQKPGKPFWFGQSKKGKAVFALPGNPVSTQICACRYVVPYLFKMVGASHHVPAAVLSDDLSVNTDLTYFAPVKINYDRTGSFKAVPVSVGGSGDFASLAQADGFVELEAGRKKFSKGFVAPFYSW